MASIDVRNTIIVTMAIVSQTISAWKAQHITLEDIEQSVEWSNNTSMNQHKFELSIYFVRSQNF